MDFFDVLKKGSGAIGDFASGALNVAGQAYDGATKVVKSVTVPILGEDNVVGGAVNGTLDFANNAVNVTTNAGGKVSNAFLGTNQQPAQAATEQKIERQTTADEEAAKAEAQYKEAAKQVKAAEKAAEKTPVTKTTATEPKSSEVRSGNCSDSGVASSEGLIPDLFNGAKKLTDGIRNIFSGNGRQRAKNIAIGTAENVLGDKNVKKSKDSAGDAVTSADSSSEAKSAGSKKTDSKPSITNRADTTNDNLSEAKAKAESIKQERDTYNVDEAEEAYSAGRDELEAKQSTLKDLEGQTKAKEDAVTNAQKKVDANTERRTKADEAVEKNTERRTKADQSVKNAQDEVTRLEQAKKEDETNGENNIDSQLEEAKRKLQEAQQEQAAANEEKTRVDAEKKAADEEQPQVVKEKKAADNDLAEHKEKIKAKKADVTAQEEKVDELRKKKENVAEQRALCENELRTQNDHIARLERRQNKNSSSTADTSTATNNDNVDPQVLMDQEIADNESSTNQIASTTGSSGIYDRKGVGLDLEEAAEI